jgi:predicted MPP superfamily phosphohydrolase
MIERYLVRFPRLRIVVPRLPKAFDGFRIAHVSDVHYGPLVPAWFIRQLFDRVNRLAPDCIVCTGDYVSGRNVASRVDIAWSLLDRLEAPSGVYAVLGNCDYWADPEKSLKRLAESGRDVQGRSLRMDRNGASLWIAGADDLLEHHVPLDTILSGIPEGDCRIVIAHNPDTADTDHTLRIDLMLAGHTHGGQVVIPGYGIPMLPVKNKAYSFGLKRSPKGFPVFISKGIGWGIFPGRLNCLPEIPVIELVSGN